MNEREAFEAQMAASGYKLDYLITGDEYAYENTESAYLGWVVARAALAAKQEPVAWQYKDYSKLEYCRLCGCAAPIPSQEPVAWRRLHHDVAEMVLWQAIETAGKIGNKSDDKLILEALRNASVYLCAAAPTSIDRPAEPMHPPGWGESLDDQP